MLVALSMALFVVPADEVIAQTGGSPGSPRAISLCINRSNGELYKPSSDLKNQCPSGFELINDIPTTYNGICVIQQNNRWGVLPPEGELTLDANGRNCVFADDNSTVAGPFVRFNTLPTYTPPGSGNSNGNSGNSNNSNGNSGNGNSGNTNSPPQVQGDCEDGFHKVGPLCVPNSPFTNKDALVNSADAPGLAVKIIRILLYFAGIVAVIMAIIGGYRVMTAQGNEAQAASGRKTLTNAIIGLIIVILSYIIIQAVINFITK